MESTECLSDHRNGQLREGIKSRRRASSTTSLKKVPKVKPQISTAPQPTWRSLISCQVLSPRK
ncbi:hypothetical protein NC652_013141 [Populus alba x Populus x berolinensis]|nr:hypothetical protein NC652_013141 [Populus alba x Populus x berolinensis]